MVGGPKTETQKNSLFVCFAVSEVNQLFYHKKWLNEHILSFFQFSQQIFILKLSLFLFFTVSSALSVHLSRIPFPSPFSIRKQDHQIIYSNVLSLSLSSYSFQETCNTWKDERRGGFEVSTLCESCTTLFFRFASFFPSSFLPFNVLIIIVLYLLTATMTFRGLSNWCFRHLVT